MSLREFMFLAIGVNIGAVGVFAMIACRWSFRHALALAHELVQWLEAKR